MQIDNGAAEIIETLEQAGYSAYCVGGCVRDGLMGRTPNDWDIATSALPAQMQPLFEKTVATGVEHGTITVLLHGSAYEVTAYRIDGEYCDHRHPEEVTFVENISGDLARRDFTVNAMAYHPKKGLLDLFGGQQDIQNHVLRCVGEPERRFTEDALRMLRAVRFAAQLGFSIHADTMRAIDSCGTLIGHVSAERIRDELVKLLLSNDSAGGLHLLEQSGLMAHILPELHACVGVEQHIKYHRFDVFEHTCEVVRNTPPDLSLRMAALLHDIGKPAAKTTDADGIDHFRGHADISAQLTEQILARLKFDNHTKDCVARLVKHHDREILPDKRAVKRAALKVGEDIFLPLLALKRADCLGQNLTHTAYRLNIYNEIERMYWQSKREHEAFGLRDLAVNGNDMKELGLTGSAIGDMLQTLLQHVIDHPAENKRAQLLSHARQCIKRPSM